MGKIDNKEIKSDQKHTEGVVTSTNDLTKYLTSLYIYMILLNYSSPANPLSPSVVKRYLEQQGLKRDQKTVASKLANMTEYLALNSGKGNSHDILNEFFRVQIHRYEKIAPKSSKDGVMEYRELTCDESADRRVIYYCYESLISPAQLELIRTTLLTNQYLSAKETAYLLNAIDLFKPEAERPHCLMLSTIVWDMILSCFRNALTQIQTGLLSRLMQ